jgi:hypothetical protein
MLLQLTLPLLVGHDQRLRRHGRVLLRGRMLSVRSGVNGIHRRILLVGIHRLGELRLRLSV